MKAQDILTKLCEKYSLGEMQREALPAEGGLLHRMYHVVTDRGDYAIKLLNPDIMKRPAALGNMMASESIARAMAAHGGKWTTKSASKQPSEAIPALPALEFGGRQLLVLEQNDAPQYAFVYPWLNDARSLYAPEIGEAHCRWMGRILGLIHQADLQPGDLRIETEREEVRPLYNWQDYLSLAQRQEAPWRSAYEAILPDLLRWDRAAVEALETSRSRQVISHRDLDPKNVLWQGTRPWVIDWEAAGSVNPFQELLEVLNYWGREKSSGYVPSLCQAVLQEYRQYMNLEGVNWTPVFACSYDGMLGWLEYTLKKALGLEGDDPALGTRQMLSACQELRLYDTHAKTLREMLTIEGGKEISEKSP